MTNLEKPSRRRTQITAADIVVPFSAAVIGGLVVVVAKAIFGF